MSDASLYLCKFPIDCSLPFVPITAGAKAAAFREERNERNYINDGNGAGGYCRMPCIGS
jgi:hypothetical protein